MLNPADFSCCRAYFDRDPVLYIDMEEAIARGEGRVLYASPGGGLLAYDQYRKDGQDSGFAMCAADLPTAEAIFALLPERPGFIVGHELLYQQRLQERFPTLAPGHSCYQVAYMKKRPLPLPELGFSLRSLTPADFPAVRTQYHLAEDSYLHRLLEQGALYGAFSGNVLAGFAGIHAEGSVGLLEVLPQYRRRGLGSLLESYIINRSLEKGQVPYGQVFTDNAVSLALQDRLGLTRSAGTLFWATED